MIKHVWFDFSETIAFINKDRHNRLRYETYAKVVGRPVTPELIDDFESRYKSFNNSNAAVFRSLGREAGFWSEQVNSVPASELYRLSSGSVPAIIKNLNRLVSVSIFSNINVETILPALGISNEWFVNKISSKMLKEPKPALDGFYKIVELSKLPPDEILYIGDHVGKDVLPAKKVGLITGLIFSKSPEADFCFENFEEVLDLIKNQKYI